MGNMMRLAADAEAVTAAEQALGVSFPESLRMIYMTSNGLEMPGGWMFYPVFDPANPRKTSNSILYENTPGKGRWEYMSDDLIAIAGNDIGNKLVLKKESGTLGSEVLVWNHARNTTKNWGRSLDHILELARKRAECIEATRAHYMRAK